MKLVISYPATGATKTVDLDDEVIRKANLSDFRMGQEIDGQVFAEALQGYRFRISGGQDKDGFAMKQGVMSAARVMLLMKPGTTGYAAWRARSGERKRRSVRGCILGNDLATVSVVVIKCGAKPVEGLTDVSIPRRLGPKRANNIRKLFGLTSQDVTKFVVRRKIAEKDRSEKNLPNKRAFAKAPKIQRLIEPAIKVRRARKLADKKARSAASTAARKEFISMILSKRRDQRHQAEARDAVAERAVVRKTKADVAAARRKAFEKANKGAKTAPKAAAKVAPKAAPKRK
jgi:small subunit ribosomal protein S6e